ncbi:hypothetical protein O0882_23560 [Janthinobacterium sp. SUN073]|uniref:hypothetical protein n=1 Tax=Janthinobacterium sp. SUN073 TaxID=3004102 RepID=UPI0025AFEEDA|nr:hypothetical protein [Janthinobacterium sp. SUN073]MDN2699298.1 hypothetical protein [Janthinobacterium sp. SUN073]
MNSDTLVSDGHSELFDRERELYNMLGLELGDLIVANVASIDLVEVQSRLHLIGSKFQRENASPHIGAMLTVLQRVILERQRMNFMRRSVHIDSE